MKGFLEQYGIGIFTLVIIAILIAFAGPLGGILKAATNDQIKNVDKLGTERVKNADRPEEPKTSQDYVYACLYNNGEFVLSANEIKSKENVRRDYGKVKLSSDELPPWFQDKNRRNVIIVRFETAIKPTTCRSWFSEMENLEKIENIEYLYTDKCTSMHGMFNHCRNLTFINLKYFDTSKVVTMYWMFNSCISLTSLDISSFNTSKVYNMEMMFANTPLLKTITVGNGWTTAIAESKNKTTSMFLNCGTDHVTQK